MKKSIKETVREAILPTVTELGYRIWDVTYQKIGADYHLEITTDSDEGINIDDCEKVHRAIDPILDEIDPIEDFYYLEVSSPGVERVLTIDEHFAAMAGSEVEIKLYKGKDGTKKIEGVLQAFVKTDDDYLVKVADHNGKEWDLQLAEIAKARLAVVI